MAQVWTHAMITYNAGKSYSIGGYRFVQGTPKRCNDRRIVRKMKAVVGTGVQDYFKEESAPEEETPRSMAIKPQEKTALKKTAIKKKVAD